MAGPVGARQSALAACAALLALAAVVYLGVAAWAGTRAADGTTVAGVDVGGLDRTGVSRRLETELAPRARRPITVRAGSGRTTLVPEAAGLALDVSATTRRLTGFTLRPAAIWKHLHGGGPVRAVTTSDERALSRAAATVKKALDQPLAQGSITFTAAGPRLTESQEGRALEQTGVADAIAGGWLDGAQVVLPARITKPEVAAADLQAAFDSLARPAVSGPLTVVVGDRSVSVPAVRFAALLSVQPVETGATGAAAKAPLRLAVDGAGLEKVLLAVDPQVERKPRDASVAIAGGKPVITPGVTGQQVDPAKLAQAVVPALTSAGRKATVALAVVQPERTTADVEKLGIRERVSTFTTQFPFNPPRTTNITIAARTLDGMMVEPGETFSLNKALGRRTPDKGYQQAPVINGGRLTTDYGGGVSQVSTTLFNAVFFAGLDTVEHKPHSFYIPRYPEGREATVSYPTVDQKFRNDSGKGILIEAGVSGSNLTVGFWGTKVWDVDATKGPRTNARQPRTIHDTDGECVAQSPSAGFDVVVTRIFSKSGRQVKTERFTTRYIPEDRVTCG